MSSQVKTHVRIMTSLTIINKGVWGTKMIMNEDSDTKKEVHVPQYYWKAFCYDNDGVTYSWAYIQVSRSFQL